MRKVIAAINMTLDGVFDHTAGIPDEEVHQHYADLLAEADVMLYGRITYQLMEFWRTILANPSEEKTMNEFAVAIDKVPKIVFSHSLTAIDWESASLATRNLEEEVFAWKQQSGKDIFVGSRSLILQLLKLNLIEELQLCVYPVIAGSGSLLFEDIKDRTLLKLVKTKTFTGGAIILYYQPKRR
ncbi:dihydrofolate reductase family protein [Pedobacter boryungensis]|uniref:Dihydrofolate reductase family protein n=1 Tax=Pedobacter boryungensis TaxID=869962 RepID=A0ABX2DGC4_9SPHI|nr:dihydrofolate reductase family protein [Pedobacter boryungensis]NQX33010.1 dihydrofolate reductase family protein [Pedobacter boryungensis]